MRYVHPASRRSGITPFMLFLAALAVAVLFACISLAHDPQDLFLEGVGVDERLGAQIPTDLPFRDQTGKPVQLSRYFTGAPVILTLNYYACPTLCPLVFRNLVGTLRHMGLSLGKDFRIVTLSIDPGETLARAADKSSKTYAMLGNPPEAATAWPFLTGSPDSLQRLSKSVGVRYIRVGTGDFAHPNVLIIATPDGKVSRYLYGLEQSPTDLKLALIEASGGRIGTSRLMNKALLYCFHYDPVGKKYVLFASRVMTIAMVGVLILTLGLLALLWKSEKKHPS